MTDYENQLDREAHPYSAAVNPASAAPHIGDAILAGSTDSSMGVGSGSNENYKRSETVISGERRGFIRTAPEEVRHMLTKSLTEGGVVSSGNPMNDVLECAIDLTVRCGIVKVQSGRRRHADDTIGAVEEYEGYTFIETGKGDDQRVVIKVNGLLSPSQQSALPGHLVTPVGVLLGEPRVEIRFSRFRPDNGYEDYRFEFGRGGAMQLERSTEDSRGDHRTAISPEDAHAYLTEQLPVAHTQDDGTTALSCGHAQIDPRSRILDFFSDISRNRYGSGQDVERPVVRAKLDKYGYDAVAYVPPDYFTAGNRNGELFSADYPESMVADDALLWPDPKQRVASIAADMDSSPSQQTVKDVIHLIEGLPAGFSMSAVLLRRDDKPEPVPDLRPLPTVVSDKAASYLLHHPERVRGVMEAYRAMYSAVADEPVSTFAVQLALETGLLDRNRSTARSEFEAFVKPWSKINMKAPNIQTAINQSFDELVELGRELREQGVYTPDELNAFERSGKAMLRADPSVETGG